jgi:V/A-type H+/Na+-transporting ATPase subunit I
MRVDVEKFLILGAQEERRAFFEEAQKEGIIHFIDPNPKGAKDIPPEIQNLLAAIKVLRGLPPMEQDETREYVLADGLVNKILHLHQELVRLGEQERVLYLDIARVQAFGDFSHEDIAYIEQTGQRVIQFFVAKAGATDGENLPEGLIFLTNEHGLDYFMAINKESVQYEGLSEMRIDATFRELRGQLASVKKQAHDIDHRLKNYSKYNHFLHRALTFKLNTYFLHSNENYSEKPLEGYLFAITGWVPVDKVKNLHALAEKTGVHVEQVAIEPHEIIPTYLENQGVERIGQDLVGIYDTPSHTDKDPSIWILIFFATFFAMIVGDAGYGLIFILIALYIRYKYTHLKGLGYRVWQLVLILGGATIIWGALTASYFGVELDVKNPLRKVSLISWLVEKKAEYHFNHKDEVYQYYVKEFPQLKNAKTPDEFLHNATTVREGKVQHTMYFKFYDNVLFEIALLVGVIHIMISLLRYIDRNWSAIGWILFIIGAYLYAPHYLDATSIIHFAFGIPKSFANNGLYLMAGGITLAFALGLIQHRLKGLLEPMTVIQIFADTMSYLRIYALSLAGAMVSATINEFAGATIFVVGALLFIIGHVTNIALSIMGGVIHGLRLNFLEWYHYSFEGGGKKFNPLRLLEKDKDK